MDGLSKNFSEDKRLFETSANSEVIKEAYSAIEELRPNTRHPANLRLLLLQLEKQPLLLALMAHPEKYGTPYGPGVGDNIGIGSMAAFRKLQAAGITHLVALEKFEYDILADRWITLGKQNKLKTHAHLFSTEDMKPVSEQSLEGILKVAQNAASVGGGMVIYCTKGFGRTGQAASHLIMNSDPARSLPRDSGALLPVKDVSENEVEIPSHLAASIKALRSLDPPHGSDLKAHNSRSSSEGTSVETVDQIKALASANG